MYVRVPCRAHRQESLDIQLYQSQRHHRDPRARVCVRTPSCVLLCSVRRALRGPSQCSCSVDAPSCVCVPRSSVRAHCDQPVQQRFLCPFECPLCRAPKPPRTSHAQATQPVLVLPTACHTGARPCRAALYMPASPSHSARRVVLPSRAPIAATLRGRAPRAPRAQRQPSLILRSRLSSSIVP